jgi:DNA-directed RNA polymerase specialized sigma24 family protein
METVTIPARTRTRTTPEKTLTVTAVASRAIDLAVECAAEIDRTRDRLSELAEKRADAIRMALETGLSQADVGRLLGISGQAVHNILRQH